MMLARKRFQCGGGGDRELQLLLGVDLFAPGPVTVQLSAYQRRRRREPFEQLPPEVFSVRFLLLAQPRNIVFKGTSRFEYHIAPFTVRFIEREGFLEDGVF